MSSHQSDPCSRTGEVLVIGIASANRDESVYEDAEPGHQYEPMPTPDLHRPRSLATVIVPA
jgi:hypothetical protein